MGDLIAGVLLSKVLKTSNPSHSVSSHLYECVSVFVVACVCLCVCVFVCLNVCVIVYIYVSVYIFLMFKESSNSISIHLNITVLQLSMLEMPLRFTVVRNSGYNNFQVCLVVT